eukprot:5825937-Pyramimonas_sp.AAC.1
MLPSVAAVVVVVLSSRAAPAAAALARSDSGARSAPATLRSLRTAAAMVPLPSVQLPRGFREPNQLGQ